MAAVKGSGPHYLLLLAILKWKIVRQTKNNLSKFNKSMSDTVATDSVGVRWVLMAKWFFSPSSLSRFGSVRSSRWLGEEMKVDDPTEGFSSARETCQWMDGRTQGGRHKGLLGRRRGPSAPPTLPRSLFLSFYYTLFLYFSLFLSLSLSLYPPPPTYFSSW